MDEKWHRDHEWLPTPQELYRVKVDGYYVYEASGEDLQHALEHWGSSDVKAKMIVHTILRERKKASNPLATYPETRAYIRKIPCIYQDGKNCWSAILA
jgi:hypothetical protein